MKRKRSEAQDRAYMLWRESGGTMPLKDIAEMLHIQPSKVRKWKSLDAWSIEETLHKDEEKSSGEIVCRKIGAPIGNKNSVGHKSSVPRRNANAVTTGEYKTIYLDALTEAERAMYEAIDTNPFAAIDETIRLLTLRERRMLDYLNELHEQELCETKDIYELQAKPMIANVYDELTGEASEVEVTQEQRTLIGKVEKRQPLIDRILMVEEALTRVQERKIRALETKHRMLLKWQKQTQAAPPNQSS